MFELPPSTVQSIDYVSSGVGLLARSLTILFTVLAAKQMVSAFSWAMEQWKRVAALIILISIAIVWVKVNQYIDSVIVVLLWLKSVPRDLIIDPLSEVLKWLVAGWDSLSSVDSFGPFNTVT